MQNRWFTSDNHFFHSFILTAGNGRPFDTVEEMNDAMVYNWNQCVKPGDLVYHLGDFSFGTKVETEQILQRLKGNKHFVRGNHDHTMPRLSGYFQSFQDYKEIKVDGQKVVLFHFPILSFHDIHKGAFHLHGHTHNNLPEDGNVRRMDVGVDGHAFYPWHWDEILEHLGGRSGLSADFTDHHLDKMRQD